MMNHERFKRYEELSSKLGDKEITLDEARELEGLSDEVIKDNSYSVGLSLQAAITKAAVVGFIKSLEAF